MWKRIRALLFGAPKDVHDQKTFHGISLVAILAWVGLGADGLSSSAYGPPEAFKALVEHGEINASLAIWLALGTALTVFIISYAYTRIIEHFPTGGGGYVVATKLLGPRFGVVSGSALLVDYMLTITTSIASGGDAIFDLVPRRWFDETEIFDAQGKLLKVLLRDGRELVPADVAEQLNRAALGTWSDPVQRAKLCVEIGAIVLLILLNIRGVKESVTTILPVFMAFVVTHVVLLGVSIGGHVGDIGAVAHETKSNLHRAVAAIGFFAALRLTVRAYSLGGGTYTGIEAVSNGIQIMREPKVRTAKRTMVLMATSLALTAGGLLLAYLLVHVMPAEGKTMNGLLAEKVSSHWSIAGFNVGAWFVILTLCSEAGLLFVGAQAGFVDGPRVMANMAVDSWMPHRFAALSERLSMQNGVMLMGGTAIAALVYTHGDVTLLVTMYSINVFLTFSLSNLGMSRFWIQNRRTQPHWRRHLPVHLVGLALCVTILCVTSYEKFSEGGWLTLVVTTLVVVACFAMKRHYVRVGGAIRSLDEELPDPLPMVDLKSPAKSVRALGSIDEIESGTPKPDPTKPIAILFVGGYGGLGRHALLTMLRMFPHHFKGIVFCSIAIIDSGNFKGIDEVEELEARTRRELEKYVRYAATLDLPAEAVFATGIEVAVEAEKLGVELIEKYPRALFVAGQLVFEEETFVNRLLHNETAFMIQRRLQHSGVPMIVLPVRITLKSGPRLNGPSMTSDRGGPAPVSS